MTSGIEGAAMELLRAANEHQAQGNTRAKVQPHWEAHKAGLVANSEGYDEVINSLTPSGPSLTLKGMISVVVSCVRLEPHGRHNGPRRRLPRAPEGHKPRGNEVLRSSQHQAAPWLLSATPGEGFQCKDQRRFGRFQNVRSRKSGVAPPQWARRFHRR